MISWTHALLVCCLIETVATPFLIFAISINYLDGIWMFRLLSPFKEYVCRIKIKIKILKQTPNFARFRPTPYALVKSNISAWKGIN